MQAGFLENLPANGVFQRLANLHIARNEHILNIGPALIPGQQQPISVCHCHYHRRAQPGILCKAAAGTYQRPRDGAGLRFCAAPPTEATVFIPAGQLQACNGSESRFHGAQLTQLLPSAPRKARRQRRLLQFPICRRGRQRGRLCQINISVINAEKMPCPAAIHLQGVRQSLKGRQPPQAVLLLQQHLPGAAAQGQIRLAGSSGRRSGHRYEGQCPESWINHPFCSLGFIILPLLPKARAAFVAAGKSRGILNKNRGREENAP